MGKIFGGSKSKATSRTPTGFQSLPRFAREAFEEAVQRGTELSQDPSLFAPPSLTGEQQQALSALSTQLDPTTPAEFQAGLETFFNPFEEQVVQSAISDILEQGAGIRSDIGTMASEAGGFGGTRQALLESELFSDVLQRVGDVSARTRATGFESAANRVLADLARSQSAAVPLFQLGEVGRGIQQQQQLAPVTAVNYLTGLASALPTGGGGVSVERQAADPLGSLGQLAGGIGSALGGMAMLSDERLKENIEKVGARRGHTLYEFNYIGDSLRYRGVMAQEVMKTRPEAVMETKDGYFLVDYAQLGFEMETV